MSHSLSLPSFAKINWTLRILGRRDDGFHELFTVFQTVSLCDTITFEQSDDVSVTCSDPAVPTDERNLVIKAARSLGRATNSTRGAKLHLDKKIPSPGGLGGGSSNAAVTLIGLTRLWDLEISDDILHELAADLGSDVPFFLTGGTAIGTGRGEHVGQVDDLEVENLLLVTPDVAVSTGDAFERLAAPTLTFEERNRILTVCRNEADSLDLHHSVLRNDFEPSVFAAHPEIQRVKNSLLELGAANAALSGSGGSVFASFDNKETRQAAQKALDIESTWRKFAVSTISRSKYREALGL